MPSVSPKDYPATSQQSGTLRTVPSARLHVALSNDRELSARWQRAAQLLLAEAHIALLSKQIALALFYEGKLVLAA